jgi:hypothetical protein
MICLLALLSNETWAQDAAQSDEKLEKKYAPFLGVKGAREYLQGLPFQIGDSTSQTVELRIRGQSYQAELLALNDVDDCEACHGQIDVLIFHNGQPFFLEKNLIEGSGWHGHPYIGDERTVVPLGRDSEGLAFSGEMWMPRGCRSYTADLYGIDVEARQFKQIFADGETVCEGDQPVLGVKLSSKGLDAEGRGLFAFTTIKQRGRRQVRILRTLRFEAKQWKLVESHLPAARPARRRR